MDVNNKKLDVKVEDSNLGPRISKVSLWVIILIVIAIVVVIWLFISAINRSNQNKTATTSNIQNNADYQSLKGKYIIIWGDDFQRGTNGLSGYYDCNITVDNMLLPYVEEHLIFEGSNKKTKKAIYPDLERWTLLQAAEYGPVYFDDDLDNCYIKNGYCHLNMFESRTIIEKNCFRRSYNITSAKLVSRIAISNGFFMFRFKPPSIENTKIKISLLPYYNVGMNKVGSDYGQWPSCGEITILELDTRDYMWRGYLTYADKNLDPVYNPPIHKDKLKYLGPDLFHNISLEWKDSYIRWIYNGRIEQGCIEGKQMQKICSKEWSTYIRDCHSDDDECFSNVTDLNSHDCHNHEVHREHDSHHNKAQKMIPAPAPFNQPFHIVIELTTDQDNIEYTSCIMDWIKIYSIPNLNATKTDGIDINSIINTDN